MKKQNYNRFNAWLLSLLAAFGALHPRTAAATTRTVTSLNDSGPGSLRELIAQSVPGDTIYLAVAGTIRLTSAELTIGRDLTIIGPGPDRLAVDGNDAFQVFQVTATVSISGLTIANGSSTFGGGGIENFGTLTVSNCTIAGNRCANPPVYTFGAGILNWGTLTVNRCTFFQNNNAPTGHGGGIYNNGTLAVNNSTFNGNQAVSGFGGAIYNNSTHLLVTNSTFAGNFGTECGGIFSKMGGSTLLNCIVADNSAGSSSASPDCAGAFISLGHNLIGKRNGSSGWQTNDLTGTIAAPLDPELGPFGTQNGGSTLTRTLLPGSAAIDAGDDSVTNTLATDQRGYPRKYGAHVDIGAVEVGSPNLVVTNPNDTGPGSLRESLVVVAPGGAITFAPNVTGTITLTSGELGIGKDVVINGPGAKVLTVSGNNTSRVFHFTAGESRITNLRIANGRAYSGGGGIAVEGNSSLTVSGCAVDNCYASGVNGHGGGGIYVGPVTLSGSPALVLNACTISSNTTPYYGGGLKLSNSGSVTLLNCTVSGNRTLDNSAGDATGGGISVESTTLNINNSTIASNTSAGMGGGIFRVNGTVTVTSSLIAGNTAVYDPDVSGQLHQGVFTSGRYNLIGRTNGSVGFSSATHDLFGSVATPLNPKLGPLKDNGGSTLTMALLAGSPAIDQGRRNGVTTDQRNKLRPFDCPSVPNASGGDGSDIGAFELDLPTLHIARVAGNVLVSWPSNYTEYTLEARTNLNGPGSWTTVPGTPAIVGSQFTVTNSVVTGGKFYRLSGP